MPRAGASNSNSRKKINFGFARTSSTPANPKQLPIGYSMTQANRWVGIDVSQDKLDLCCWPQAEMAQYANSVAGVAQLIDALQAWSPQLVVMEATGGLERLVLGACQAADIPVARVNPRQVKGFAQALGKAKTDALDAQMLAQYAFKMEPAPQTANSESAQILVDWVRRRRQLVGMRVAEQNRLARAAASVLADIEDSIADLEARIQTATDQIAALIQAQPDFPEKQQILLSVKGIGDQSTALLLAELPELGQLSDKKIARLVGVAPINHDSGKYRGQRRIQGGRITVRTGLYMATLVATQWNPVIRPFYQRLRDNGKRKKVAIVACMRKLLVILNAMLRDRQPWRDPVPQTQT
jgi:transposase